MLANQVQKYIDQIIDGDLNGYEIIHIKKKPLLEIEHIKVESNRYHNMSFKETDFSFDSDIDLSSIKSLSMNIYILYLI